MSTTKTKDAQYDLPGIEDMVLNIWSPVKVAYDKYALWGISHWREQQNHTHPGGGAVVVVDAIDDDDGGSTVIIGTNATDDGANIGNNPQQGVCYEVSVKQLKGLKMKRKTCKVGDGVADGKFVLISKRYPKLYRAAAKSAMSNSANHDQR
ncbi:hypothetical protein Tco_0270713 [Tanacetum coccineum]